MAFKLIALKKRVEELQEEIDSLAGNFFTEENEVDFRYELDNACLSLDDAIEVVERDDAYKKLVKEMAAKN